MIRFRLCSLSGAFWYRFWPKVDLRFEAPVTCSTSLHRGRPSHWRRKADETQQALSSFVVLCRPLSCEGLSLAEFPPFDLAMAFQGTAMAWVFRPQNVVRMFVAKAQSTLIWLQENVMENIVLKHKQIFKKTCKGTVGLCLRVCVHRAKWNQLNTIQ